MTTPPRPHLSRRSTTGLVWVVPLLALVVAVWLIYRDWHTRGPEIAITFIDGSGIQAGRTILQHQGVAVGRVTRVELTGELDRVEVRVRLERSAAGIARAGSLFWVVQPQISFAGIQGLDTLLSGARLAVRPGTGEEQETFVGLERPPPPYKTHLGRAFILESERLNGIAAGTAVYFRDVRVGEVEECRLAEDARRVLVRIRLEAAYADLIRPNTQFWSSGGLSVRVGLRGAQFNAGSLASLLSGGITFATPDTDAVLPPAAEGTRFALHREPENDWLKWNPAIPISPGPAAPVTLSGVTIGAEPVE